MDMLALQPRAPMPIDSATAAQPMAARNIATRAESDHPVTPVEPPSDPPIVKGLGIPPLHLTFVGDGDEPPLPPEGWSTSLARLEDPGPQHLDLRR